MRDPGERRLRWWPPKISGATTPAKAGAPCRVRLSVSLSGLQPIPR